MLYFNYYCTFNQNGTEREKKKMILNRIKNAYFSVFVD